MISRVFSSSDAKYEQYKNARLQYLLKLKKFAELLKCGDLSQDFIESALLVVLSFHGEHENEAKELVISSFMSSF